MRLWAQCALLVLGLQPVCGDRVYTTSVSSVQGKRSHMEDEVCVSSSGNFACVFDGHGGGFVSKYLRSNFYSTFLQSLPSDVEWTGDLVAEAFKHSLSKCDAEIGHLQRWRHQGSTVSAVCLHGDAYLSCLNVGDSRAVLGRRGGTALELSEDHKPNLPSERSRIEGLGGVVKWHGLVGLSGAPIEGTGCYRVNGNLALSRAAGDHAMRPFVSCEPDVRKVRLGEEDEFVLIASDGLWDVFASHEACAFMRDCASVLGAPSGLSQQQQPQTQPQVRGSKASRVELMHAVSSFKAKQGRLEAAGGSPARGTAHRVAAFRRLSATLLVEAALRRGSSDNISCVVVWLRDIDE